MDSKALDSFLSLVYKKNAEVQEEQRKRYKKLISWHQRVFKKENLYLVSTPGRVEIGGNHTDHNQGCVLAGSVNLDSIAVVSKSGDTQVRIHSEGYEQTFEADLADLNPIDHEKETTSALIRGIASRLHDLGYKIGGFEACISSDVLPGSGLSSSASIEVLIGTIFNALFNEHKIDPIEIAKIGQYAENNYFGKPCGLMDQVACAVGGVVGIDFEDPENPEVDQIDFSVAKFGYKLVVVNTGGSHADLTDEYAAVPAEMKAVAAYFRKDVLRGLTIQDVMDNASKLHEKLGDRAILRALHFFRENDRVAAQIKAIKADDLNLFLKLIQQSGDSSFKFLQNVFTSKAPAEQKVSLALALTERFINDKKSGASRIHGGGFAGTILVFIPEVDVPDYKQIMEKIFGQDSVLVLSIRSIGATSAKLF